MGLQALFARATSTVKNVGFMCFMAYMSGNGIQIFSILMTFNLLSAPISAILSSGQSEYIHLHCCPWLGVRVDGGTGAAGWGRGKARPSLLDICLRIDHLSFRSTACAVFPREDDWPQLDVLTPRLIFCAIQLGQLVFGLYKLEGMGLLPVYPSDWISTMAVPPCKEHSYAAL